MTLIKPQHFINAIILLYFVYYGPTGTRRPRKLAYHGTSTTRGECLRCQVLFSFALIPQSGILNGLSPKLSNPRLKLIRHNQILESFIYNFQIHNLYSKHVVKILKLYFQFLGLNNNAPNPPILNERIRYHIYFSKKAKMHNIIQ